jgi:hypothetical protein
VTAYPGFGVLLTRLLAHRGTDVAALSSSSSLSEAELESVLAGGPVSDAQLRALAPVLGLHTADLFVIANVAVPEDLTPLDRAAGSVAERIIHLVLALPSEQRAHIRRLVEQLPQEPRPQEDPSKTPVPRVYDLEAAGFGAMLVTMLCSNRNLHSIMAAAKTVATMTSGDMYLSAATYPLIGSGRAELHPRWVASLAMVLGIAAGDLAAITGIELDESLVREDPVVTETAELLWKLRRVSAAQATHVHEQARSMLLPVPEGAADGEWNRVFHVGDVWWGAPRER